MYQEQKKDADLSKRRDLKELARHVTTCYEASSNHRSAPGGPTGLSIRDRFMACLRQRLGVYDPSTLAKIKAQGGGSEEFFNITDTKCAAGEAWLKDVIAPLRDRSWDCDATPIPDLSSEIKDAIVQEVVMQYQQQMMQGMMPTPDEVREMTMQIYDERLKEVKREAEGRADRMAQKIEDQFKEGGFYSALEDFMRNLTTFPCAFLKGPVIQIRKRLKWENGAVVVIEEPIPTWTAPSPFDVFFGPNARSCQDSYLIELVYWDRSALSMNRDAEGWSREEIDAVLSEGIGSDWIRSNENAQERSDLEGKANPEQSKDPDSMVAALEFWGSVKGSALVEWGMEGVEDKNKFYDITCVLIGGHIVRAIMNPDPLGMKPYSVTSFEKVPGSIMGWGIPEKMGDCQRGYNAVNRAIMNNMALASGPQVAVNIDTMAKGFDYTKMTPWGIWPYHTKSAVLAGRPPVEFHDVPSNVNELVLLADKFEARADDRTMIPKYQYGESDIGGAGATASGLSMLMNSSAKGIKQVVGNVGVDIVHTNVERQYNWNLLYLDDEEYGALKGDVRVVPRGYLEMIMREQLQQRRLDFMDRTNNPTDLAIIGQKGRAVLLRSVAVELDLPTDDVVPDDATLRQQAEQAMLEQMQMQAMQQTAGGEDAAGSRGTGQSGPGPNQSQS